MRTGYITTERNRNGAVVVTGLLRDGYGEYFHSVQYHGYTVREAVALFKRDYAGKLAANA